MARAHGKARRELEVVGADPATDDTEGTASEDRWLGRGSHGWWDRLLKKLGRA
ncbi:MAG TPA: hypothetical protein VGL60_02155 [Acidimicrobiales bacterium]|jgi:hypothetical protein